MSISWNGENAPVPPGSSYGYARVSTTDQDLDVQYEALEKAGCRVIRAEKAMAPQCGAGTNCARCSTSSGPETSWLSPGWIASPGRWATFRTSSAN